MAITNDYVKFLENAPHSTRSEGVLIAKDLLGELTPYRVIEMLHKKVVQMEPLFMAKLIDALSTNCLLRLNKVEKEVLSNYVKYQDSLLNSLIINVLTPEERLVAEYVDLWIYQSITNSLTTDPVDNCTTA